MQILARDQCAPWGLALFDGAVYWTAIGDGAVRRVPLSGGAVETIAADQDQPRPLFASYNALCWVNSGDGAVMRLGADGVPVRICVGPPGAWGVLEAYGQVCWASEGGLHCAPSAGGEARCLLERSRAPGGLTAVGGHLYLLDQRTLFRVSVDGGEPLELPGFGGRGLASDGSWLYWSGDRAGLWRRHLTGGEPECLFRGNPMQRGKALIVQGGWVYWSDGGWGAICGRPVRGGPARTLPFRQCAPRALAADSQRLYWVDAQLGCVMAVDKSVLHTGPVLPEHDAPPPMPPSER